MFATGTLSHAVDSDSVHLITSIDRVLRILTPCIIHKENNSGDHYVGARSDLDTPQSKCGHFVLHVKIPTELCVLAVSHQAHTRLYFHTKQKHSVQTSCFGCLVWKVPLTSMLPISHTRVDPCQNTGIHFRTQHAAFCVLCLVWKCVLCLFWGIFPQENSWKSDFRRDFTLTSLWNSLLNFFPVFSPSFHWQFFTHM